MLRVTSNIKQVIRRLDARQRRQLPFAIALALTRTAQDVKGNVEKAIDRNLDRPTPFTRRGVGIRKATKSRPVATVFIKDIQAGYLEIEETGGTRRPKGRALVLPSAAKRNKYGNLPRGSIKRLRARPDTFSGSVNGVAGIWQRKGRRLKLMVAYEPRTQYRPRLRFQETAIKTARKRFDTQFRRALEQAFRTAR